MSLLLFLVNFFVRGALEGGVGGRDEVRDREDRGVHGGGGLRNDISVTNKGGDGDVGSPALAPASIAYLIIIPF